MTLNYTKIFIILIRGMNYLQATNTAKVPEKQVITFLFSHSSPKCQLRCRPADLKR